MVKSRKLCNLLFVLLVLLTLPVGVAFADTSRVKVYVDGVELQTQAILHQNRTLVPLASIGLAVGAEVDWNPADKSVYLEREDKQMLLFIGDKTALVNEQEFEMEVPASIIDGKTYVPLGFVGKALGVDVGFDTQAKTVIVNTIESVEKLPTGEVSVQKAKVLRVIDGDTIEVMLNNEKIKVRLIGVDTPESKHPKKERNTQFGVIATQYTKDKLEGKTILLETDAQTHDKYGRLLAYVWVDDGMFNSMLLRDGMAKVSTYPPNVKYAKEFVKAEEKARDLGKGVWENIESAYGSK